MIDYVEQIFELSEVKKKFLAKKIFYEECNLNKRDTDLLSQNVEKIYFIATFNKKFGVPKYITKELYYVEIYFLWVELRNMNYNKKIAKVIQQCFPKLIVLLMDYDNEIQLNTAFKRLNLINNKKIVVENLEFSHIVNMDFLNREEEKFLNSLKIKNQSYENMYKMYQDISNKIFLSKLIDIIGFYPENMINIKKIKKMVYKIEEKEYLANKLRNENKRINSFSKGLQYHLKFVQTKEEIRKIIEELKGVC